MRAPWKEVDVGDQRDAREVVLELPDMIEVRSVAREDVDHRDSNRLPFTDLNERSPIVAGDDLMAVANRRAKTLKVRCGR